MSSESPPPPPPPARKRARAVKGRKAAAETDEEDDEDDEGVDDSEGGKLFTSHDGPGYSWGMPVRPSLQPGILSSHTLTSSILMRDQRAEYLALSPSAKKQLRNRVGAKVGPPSSLSSRSAKGPDMTLARMNRSSEKGGRITFMSSRTGCRRKSPFSFLGSSFCRHRLPNLSAYPSRDSLLPTHSDRIRALEQEVAQLKSNRG